MTKNDKARVLYVATFAWKEWTRYTEMAGGDPWLHLERRQANRDILTALQVARFIEDFSLHKGVLRDGEWHQHTKPLPHAPKFKPKGKPVKVEP